MYTGLHVKNLLFLLELLMKLGFSQQIFEGKKLDKYQISWKSTQVEPFFPMRTDTHDEAYSRLSLFRERV